MEQYKVTFTVNNVQTETIVSAYCGDYAKELVIAQYPNSRVNIIFVQKI